MNDLKKVINMNMSDRVHTQTTAEVIDERDELIPTPPGPRLRQEPIHISFRVERHCLMLTVKVKVLVQAGRRHMQPKLARCHPMQKELSENWNNAQLELRSGEWKVQQDNSQKLSKSQIVKQEGIQGCAVRVHKQAQHPLPAQYFVEIGIHQTDDLTDQILCGTHLQLRSKADDSTPTPDLKIHGLEQVSRYIDSVNLIDAYGGVPEFKKGCSNYHAIGGTLYEHIT